MTRIALVDHDRNFLTSASQILEAEGFKVDTFNDSQKALHAFGRHQPDMAVLHVKMPKMNGIDMLQSVRKKLSIPVILMSENKDEIDEVLGLRMGADDYVNKPMSHRLLLERIRAIFRRQNGYSDDTLQATEDDQEINRGDLKINPLRYTVSWKDHDIVLTVSELQVLQMLAKRPGVVKSREQLMDVVYEDHIYVDDRTIDSHIKRIRKKFRDVDPTFSAIETIYAVGYRFRT